MLYVLLSITILLPCSQAFPSHSVESYRNWDKDYSAEDSSEEDSSAEDSSTEDDSAKGNWDNDDSAEDSSAEDSWEIEFYIEHFYPCKDKVNHTMKEKIEKMQKFFHLAVTGVPDSETMKVIHRPRCGVPDALEYNKMPGKAKWEKNDLTYRINNYTTDMDQGAVQKAIAAAFKVWCDVTPLTVKEVQGPADIEIWFSRRAHGDFNPFDGKGGTLAHAFAPGLDIGGDCHFDEDEKWSEENTDINLFVVAAHEFGHSLGLDHSEDPDALMYPTYSYMEPATFKLPEDDKKGIQSIYGSNPRT